MGQFLIKDNELQNNGIVKADGAAKMIVGWATDWNAQTATINVRVGGVNIPIKRQSDGSDLTFTANAAEIIDRVGQGLEVSVTGITLAGTDGVNIALF